MKRVFNRINITSLAILLMLTAAPFSCCEKCPPEPTPKKENKFRAKFTATPDSFSGRGGAGEVFGLLQEISPEGEIVGEIPLKVYEFQLSVNFHKGDIEFKGNKFTIAEQ